MLSTPHNTQTQYSSEQLGHIRLLPTQTEIAARASHLLQTHGGALLADDVGSGKTFAALATARHYSHIHIIAPAQLIRMWQHALLKAFPDNTGNNTGNDHDSNTHTSIRSLEHYSRGTHQPLNTGHSTIVIIDEAHRLRNSNTARYRNISRVVTGNHILLISATPLFNRQSDLINLCSLFCTPEPQHSNTQHPKTNHRFPSVDQLIIRTAPPTQHLPAVRKHKITAINQDSHTLKLILQLPAPLPVLNGSAATALIRIGLLRAWASSDAALEATLRTRQLRTLALKDAINSGHHPSAADLNFLAPSSALEQLGILDLLTTQADHNRHSKPTLQHQREQLETHLQALETLTRHHREHAKSDQQRLHFIQQLLIHHNNTPIIAFSQFRHTVNALYARLAQQPGVAALSGSKARIASGAIDPRELLALFAPHAQGRKPPPDHLKLRLLLATDILAEGLNLQDAGVIVHLDLPWTHALLLQREGRCIRLGSPHSEVHTYAPSRNQPAAKALSIQKRILRKARLAQHHVSGNHTQESTPELWTSIRHELKSWLTTPHSETPSTNPGTDSSTIPSTRNSPIVSIIPGNYTHDTDTTPLPAALVLLSQIATPPPDEPDSVPDPISSRLLVVSPATRPRVVSNPSALLHTIRRISAQNRPSETAPHGSDQRRSACNAACNADCNAASTPNRSTNLPATCDPALQTVLSITQKWIERNRLRSEIDLVPSGLSSARTRAQRSLNRALSSLTVADRSKLAHRFSAVRQRLDQMSGTSSGAGGGINAGVRDALLAWCRAAPPPAPAGPSRRVETWLRAFDDDPVLSAFQPHPTVPSIWELRALVLLTLRSDSGLV